MWQLNQTYLNTCFHNFLEAVPYFHKNSRILFLILDFAYYIKNPFSFSIVNFLRYGLYRSTFQKYDFDTMYMVNLHKQ